MKVYLITADTMPDNEDVFGVNIDCFGIATTKDSLEYIIKEVRFRGFEPEISEIETDTLTHHYIGGYME